MNEGPSTYTPLARRFTNEHARELRETRELYAWVKARHDAFGETKESIGRRVYEEFDGVPAEVKRQLAFALYDLLESERYLWELPPPTLEKMNLKEFVDYRNHLYQKQYFYQNQEALLQSLHEGLVSVLYGVARELPEMEDPTPFTIPLIYALPEPGALIEAIYNTVRDEEYFDRGLFKSVSHQLAINICHASGRDPNDEHSSKPIKHASESKLPLDEMADVYLANTAFHQVFTAPVPLKLSRQDRQGHWHILGGSGSGKTVLLENLIVHDLTGEEPPSTVVIDPHSDLVRKLARADLGLGDRLIIIDPREAPPALNPFAINPERFAAYDAQTREQVRAGVIKTLDYLWAGLGLDLTGKQETYFRYCSRLLLSFPETMGRNATLLDMLNFTIDPEPYRKAIEALSPIPRQFFERDVLDPKAGLYKQTREQVRYRIQAIVESDTMAAVFGSSENKIDFYTELNRGAVILVDSAADFLKDGSPVFTRVILALVFQAVMERAAIPVQDRRDTFIHIDEAAAAFDASNLDQMLSECRKYRCGLTLSHQYLDQASSSLKASLAANTGIKFVSGLSAGDARSMAPEMRTTPDFILSQPKLQFAAYIRDVTPHAVSIPIGFVNDLPRLPDAEHALLMERNRARMSLPSTLSKPADPPKEEPEEDSDIFYP